MGPVEIYCTYHIKKDEYLSSVVTRSGEVFAKAIHPLHLFCSLHSAKLLELAAGACGTYSRDGATGHPHLSLLPFDDI